TSATTIMLWFALTAVLTVASAVILTAGEYTRTSGAGMTRLIAWLLAHWLRVRLLNIAVIKQRTWAGFQLWFFLFLHCGLLVICTLQVSFGIETSSDNGDADFVA